MKISVLTASVRPEGLDIVKQSLDKQDFPHDQFEWIIVGNRKVVDYVTLEIMPPHIQSKEDYMIKAFLERPKKKGDFYNLDKAYNDLFKNASGGLSVMWTDLTWAPADVLSVFWKHYQDDPKACVGAVGDQYDPSVIAYGVPQVVLWKDPRKRSDFGSFYEMEPIDFEMCLASIPVKAVFEAGGWDEKWDQFAALGEKEIALRMDKLGYKFFMDQSLEYRAIKHPRIAGTEEWDKRYFAGCEYMKECIHKITEGRRLKLNYLDNPK